MLSIVFFGNTKYSKIVAHALFEKFGLAAVVTIPDKPKGRNRTQTPNPVKKFAHDNKINVIETETLDTSAVKKVADLKPDFLVVSDFGLILPESLLVIPKLMALNVHQSLLPKYRGPSPAPSTILAGDKISGVTIIEMTKDVDAGPILAQKKYTLSPNETTDSLLTELNTLGAQLLALLVVRPLTEIRPLKQDESQATYTYRFTKADGKIDFDNPPDPEKLDHMIRAFYPWPGVWAEIDVSKYQSLKESKRIRLKFLPNLPTIPPSHHPTDPFLIQPQGKRPMTIKAFLNGYPQLKEKIEKLTKQ